MLGDLAEAKKKQGKKKYKVLWSRTFIPLPLSQSFNYRFLGILKSLLNSCDLAIPVFVYFLLSELLLHRNPNPGEKEKNIEK